jgi:hypothetical protein
MRNQLKFFANNQSSAEVTGTNAMILVVLRRVICCTSQSAVLLAEVVVNSGL